MLRCLEDVSVTNCKRQPRNLPRILCIFFVFCNMILYTSYESSLTYDPGVDRSKLPKSAGTQSLHRPSQFNAGLGINSFSANTLAKYAGSQLKYTLVASVCSNLVRKGIIGNQLHNNPARSSMASV